MGVTVTLVAADGRLAASDIRLRSHTVGALARIKPLGVLVGDVGGGNDCARDCCDCSPETLAVARRWCAVSITLTLSSRSL
jgi:hypothetical protein